MLEQSLDARTLNACKKMTLYVHGKIAKEVSADFVLSYNCVDLCIYCSVAGLHSSYLSHTKTLKCANLSTPWPPATP